MTWQSMETAPLNEYGKAWGPIVLIWCDGDELPWPAQYYPAYEWKFRDVGPAWVIPDAEGEPIAPESAIAWMPLPEPPVQS